MGQVVNAYYVSVYTDMHVCMYDYMAVKLGAKGVISGATCRAIGEYGFLGLRKVGDCTIYSESPEKSLFWTWMGRGGGAGWPPANVFWLST